MKQTKASMVREKAAQAASAYWYMHEKPVTAKEIARYLGVLQSDVFGALEFRPERHGLYRMDTTVQHENRMRIARAWIPLWLAHDAGLVEVDDD